MAVFQPNQPLTLRVGLRLIADASERERGGDCFESRGREGDADHAASDRHPALC